MTTRTRTAVAGLTAVLTAVALLPPVTAAAAEPGCPPPVNPGLDPGEPPPGVVPFLGAAVDPVCASVAWSEATWVSGDHPDVRSHAEFVLLARDDMFADSLSSGSLQGEGPLLLTPPDALDPRVSDELARLDPDRVIVLGGDEAVSDAVVDELEGSGYEAPRVGGTTRTDTAVGLAGLLPDAERAVLVRGYGDDATGSSWADSLSVGGWAASQGAPVLLTDGSGLPSVVADHLDSSQVAEVVVVGGTDAVPDWVLDDVAALGVDVRRVAGADRYSTAVAVATDLWGHPSAEVADGLSLLVEATQQDSWASGFAAAAYAQKWGAPTVLTGPDGLPDVTAAWLGDARCRQVEGTSAAACLPPAEPEPEPGDPAAAESGGLS